MIYYLHEDAAECAKMLADTDLAKQIKAIAQALCDLHHAITLKQPVDKKYHIPMLYKFSNEKIMEWLLTCRANYLKLVEMGLACCEEYSYRFCDACDKCRMAENELETSECGKCLGRGLLPWTKLHNLQPVIEWARDNVPDLPYHTGYQHQYNYTPIVTTPFPIRVVPEKYYIYYKGIDFITKDKPDIIESYLNYYRAQLELLADRHIKCKFDTHDRDVKAYGQCAECLTRSGSIPKPIVPTWTRRKKPTWINFN